MPARTLPLEELGKELMERPDFRAAHEASQPAFQIACRRIERGITQAHLAELVGTTQSGISRLENGTHEPNLSLLKRVAVALGCRLEVNFVPIDRTPGPDSSEPEGAASPA